MGRPGPGPVLLGTKVPALCPSPHLLAVRQVPSSWLILDSVLLSPTGTWDPLPPRRCWVGFPGWHGQPQQCPDGPGRSGILT